MSMEPETDLYAFDGPQPGPKPADAAAGSPDLPLGKQVQPVLIGKMKNGDIVIQSNGGHVRINAADAIDVPAALMMAISSR